MRAPLVAVGIVIAITAVAGGLFARARRLADGAQREIGTTAPASTSPSLELHVPHRSGNLVVDGDTDDEAWFRGGARTSAFLADDGTAGRPFSEARLLWGDGHLYVALYAADEDIFAHAAAADGPVWLGDAFRLVFRAGDVEKSLEVSPLGTLTDGVRTTATAPFDYAWQSGAHVSREIDGTVNDRADSDEEWGIEMAIPLESLGLTGKKGERIGFSAKRCDRSHDGTGHDGARPCGSWGAGSSRGTIVLD